MLYLYNLCLLKITACFFVFVLSIFNRYMHPFKVRIFCFLKYLLVFQNAIINIFQEGRTILWMIVIVSKKILTMNLFLFKTYLNNINDIFSRKIYKTQIGCRCSLDSGFQSNSIDDNIHQLSLSSKWKLWLCLKIISIWVTVNIIILMFHIYFYTKFILVSLT